MQRPPSIHRDPHVCFPQTAGERLARKLAALISVEDPQLTISLQCRLQSLHVEPAVKRVRPL